MQRKFQRSIIPPRSTTFYLFKSLNVNRPWHYALKIQFLAWDRHKNAVKWFPTPLDDWIKECHEAALYALSRTTFSHRHSIGMPDKTSQNA